MGRVKRLIPIIRITPPSSSGGQGQKRETFTPWEKESEVSARLYHEPQYVPVDATDFLQAPMNPELWAALESASSPRLMRLFEIRHSAHSNKRLPP